MSPPALPPSFVTDFHTLWGTNYSDTSERKQMKLEACYRYDEYVLEEVLV